MKNHFSVKEVARHFGVNPSTVYRLAQKGVLPAFKVGNQWRFSQEMVDAWIEENVNTTRQNQLKYRRKYAAQKTG